MDKITEVKFVLESGTSDSGYCHVLGIVNGNEISLFHYYTDELVFSWEEIIGRTVKSARALYSERSLEFITF